MAAGATEAAQSYGPDKVLIVSLTKAAAREAAGRGTPLPRRNIGTLHSICYHALGRPTMIGPAHIKEWNALYPRWSLPTDIVTGDEEGEAPAAPVGDTLFGEYQLARTRMTDRRVWRDSLRAFATAWEDFKDSADVADFTDLIERGYHELPLAPGSPALIVADEAQDLSRLEVSLLRRWAAHARDLVLTGDPLQAIYGWRGADPDLFHSADARREILCESTPSYRCPRAVWRRATAMAADLLEREGVSYQPRDAEGSVRSAPPLADWTPNGQPPGMLIASCDYMVAKVVKSLRAAGAPYHNPFNRRWNPLRPAGTLGTLLAVAATDHAFTWSELRALAPHLVADCYRGTKVAAIDSIPADDAPWSASASRAWMIEHLHPGADEGLMGCAMDEDPSWFADNATGGFQRYAAYPLAVVRRTGARELKRQVAMPARERPWAVVGTVHCSPPDEPILTSQGWTRISDLTPGWHKLGGYSWRTNGLTWGPSTKYPGYHFKVSRHPHDGWLSVITTGETRTRITPDHILRVKWDPSFFGRYVVYLMRKGSWWRIGFCRSGHRPYRSGGLGGRLATEMADDAWILSIVDNKTQAMIEEARMQAISGVHGLTFMAAKNRITNTSQLEAIHETCSSLMQARALSLLEKFKYDLRYPLYSRSGNGSKDNNMSSAFEMRAMNFLSGFMQVPVIPNSFSERQKGRHKPEWTRAGCRLERYCGEVFGIEVPPHHYYGSGGIMVHNSVKGGEAPTVTVWPDLSPAQYRQFQRPGWHGREALTRLYYVALTRAREELRVGAPGGEGFPA